MAETAECRRVWTDIPFTAGLTVYSEIPSSAGTWQYRAVVQSGSCTTANSSATTVTVNPLPTSPTVTNGERCGTGVVTLTAGGAGAGENYKWYDASTGGNLLQTNGSTFITPSINSTTNYYVTKYNTTTLCESAPRTLVVATIKAGPAVTLGYAYQKTLTVDGGQVVGSHSDFPVLIHITDNDLRDHVRNSSGFDIIFSDINYNKLDHDLVSYFPATGELLVWVRVPTLEAGINTQIRMFYGNPQITTDQSSMVPGAQTMCRLCILTEIFWMQHSMGIQELIPKLLMWQEKFQGRSFDGVNDRIIVADAPSLDGTNDEATYFSLDKLGRCF